MGKAVCPVSFSPIELPAVGRNCQHLQVFDLNVYVSVNHGIKYLDKRWSCPVCSQPLRPDDLVVDAFILEILESLRGQGDQVQEVVFEADGSWEVRAAIRKGGGGICNEDPESMGAAYALGQASIDLSESESEW